MNTQLVDSIIQMIQTLPRPEQNILIERLNQLDNQTQTTPENNTDKQWSFTDCTSYVVMKEQSITEVFTFDRHFSQMGFIRLPSSL